MKWNFKLFDNLFLGTPLMKGDGEKKLYKNEMQSSDNKNLAITMRRHQTIIICTLSEKKQISQNHKKIYLSVTVGIGIEKD